MIQPDLTNMTVAELLSAHSAVLDELKRREILRSKNNPTGDYAEWLVAEKLGLTLATKSAKGFDATDSDGLRYQIKGRRITDDNKSTQLGVIRNLECKDFNFLIAVIFNKSWDVHRAAKIPQEAVSDLAAFRKHVNGYIMHLPPTIFKNQNVKDITSVLQD
jgi:hypothetical protein